MLYDRMVKAAKVKTKKYPLNCSQPKGYFLFS